MSVLRITAELESALAHSEPMALDSILCAAHPDCIGQHLTRSAPIADIRIPHLPIARIATLGSWTFAASCEMLPPSARPALERFIKRRDPTDVETLGGAFRPRGGPGKDYCLPVAIDETPSASWLAVGDRRGVLELVRHLDALGSLRRQGYGRVRAWRVERVSESPRDVFVSPGDGPYLARRWLPVAWCLTASGVEHGTVRPPYWHPGLREPRVRPGLGCELRPEVLAAIEALR